MQGNVMFDVQNVLGDDPQTPALDVSLQIKPSPFKRLFLKPPKENTFPNFFFIKYEGFS